MITSHVCSVHGIMNVDSWPCKNVTSFICFISLIVIMLCHMNMTVLQAGGVFNVREAHA